MKYEYKAIQNSTFLKASYLNELGEEGWELTTHVYNPDTCDHFYTFKREKVSPQDIPAMIEKINTIDRNNPELKEYRDMIDRGNKQYFNSNNNDISTDGRNTIYNK